MAFDVRKLPAGITYRLIVEREFGQIFAKSGENNGNKLPMCPTLSNDRVPHLDRWMERVSQEQCAGAKCTLVQVPSAKCTVGAADLAQFGHRSDADSANCHFLDNFPPQDNLDK